MPAAAATDRHSRPYAPYARTMANPLLPLHQQHPLVEIQSYGPIEIVSTFGEPQAEYAAVRKGAINYLSKPLDADQILAAFEPEGEGAVATADDSPPSLARVEWEHIQRILTDCGGNLSLAARRLARTCASLRVPLSKR